MIPQSLLNALYFGMGIAVGQKLIATMENKTKSMALCCIAILLLAIFVSVRIPLRKEIVDGIGFFSFLVIVFFIFRNTCRYSLLKPLHFYGINSLTVLAAHVPVQIVYRRILFKFLRESTVLSGCIDTVLTIATLYFVILFFNKYFPLPVGKALPAPLKHRS
jgi:hypothetical protein